MQQPIFQFGSEPQNTTNPQPSSSHCSSVQKRLVTYGSEALDTAEHLGLILGSQKAADTLLKHFGSLAVMARASVQELLPFVSRSKALRLVSSLSMDAVALREERQSLTIDSPEIIADLCSEMRFLDREWLRVVLLNVKQQLIKVATVSQGTLNEAPAHPREIFKPVIVHSAYAFILVHNHPSGDPSPSEADLRLTRRIGEASRILQLQLMITSLSVHRLRAEAATSASRRAASFPDAFLTIPADSPHPLTTSMRFKSYPRWEPYEITPRKIAAARRAVQKEKDRYPLFPELLKHKSAEERLAAIANDRERWWRQMLDHRAKQWKRARRTIRDLTAGPRMAIKRYWQICGSRGDPDYLLSMIHNHRARKVCYWHVMAEIRRLQLRLQKSS